VGNRRSQVNATPPPTGERTGERTNPLTRWRYCHASERACKLTHFPLESDIAVGTHRLRRPASRPASPASGVHLPSAWRSRSKIVRNSVSVLAARGVAQELRCRGRGAGVLDGIEEALELVLLPACGPAYWCGSLRPARRCHGALEFVDQSLGQHVDGGDALLLDDRNGRPVVLVQEVDHVAVATLRGRIRAGGRMRGGISATTTWLPVTTPGAERRDWGSPNAAGRENRSRGKREPVGRPGVAHFASDHARPGVHPDRVLVPVSV
jgi:hypothetical protein